jgi:hypothetical protein
MLFHALAQWFWHSVTMIWNPSSLIMFKDRSTIDIFDKCCIWSRVHFDIDIIGAPLSSPKNHLAMNPHICNRSITPSKFQSITQSISQSINHYLHFIKDHTSPIKCQRSYVPKMLHAHVFQCAHDIHKYI